MTAGQAQKSDGSGSMDALGSWHVRGLVARNRHGLFEALWFVGTLAETRQRGSRGIEDLASRQDGRQRKKQWTSANFASSK
jgi:hypothetical protein